MCILILHGYSKDLLAFNLYYGQQSSVNVITGLPPPPSKSSTKASVGAWSTSSMNGSTSMSDKNVNLNMPENPKGKATKKHAEYKAIPSLTDEQFYPQKKHDDLVNAWQSIML